MFYYIFEEYKREIYNNGTRKIKEFSCAEKFYLISLILGVIGIFVFAVFNHTIAMAITILVLSVIIFIFAVHSNKFSEKDNLKKLQSYKEKKINEIEKFLKQDAVGLYNEKSINWLINMCDSTIDKNKIEKNRFY